MSCPLPVSPMQPPVIHVVGLSNSGKTTLIERLIPRLRERGVRVGTLKHAHDGFDLDLRGKDSWRHAQAGAEAVALISPARSAWLLRSERELSPAEVIEHFGDRIDLVLVEGFKREAELRLQLEPASDFRLLCELQRCRIGVFPLDLTEAEIDQLVVFCTEALRRSGRAAASVAPAREAACSHDAPGLVGSEEFAGNAR